MGNVWVFLTSILGVIFIGLFAVWSILSNVLAGIFLFTSDNFRINDEILIIGEEVRGKVLRMKLLFVILKDDDNNMIHVPNSLFFQKSVKKLAKARV